MKLTKVLAAAVLSASLLAAAGTAGALDINIYGASAQFNLWSAVAPDFLLSKGCVVNSAVSGNYGISTGTCGVGSSYPGQTINIRYTSKASYDGIWALNNIKDPEVADCANGTDRKQAATVGTVGAPVCLPVTAGASDVDGNWFIQESHGPKFGAYNTGSGHANPWVDRVFTDVAPYTGYKGPAFPYDSIEPKIDVSTLCSENPLVVPFGFFVNNAVTVQKCLGGKRDGEQCAAAGADPDEGRCVNPGATLHNVCANNAACNNAGRTDGVCHQECPGGACQAAVTIDNVTRQMANLIFSGQVANWQDFGLGFPANTPIVACMRHAGSGTQATMGLGVMSAYGWGAGLATSASEGGPTIRFNDGTGNMLDCIAGEDAAHVGGQDLGGIGFADADKKEGLRAHVTAVKYNGVWPTRANIRDGIYDNFWSEQFLYRSCAAPSTVYTDLLAFANDPARIEGLPNNRGLYYTTVNEMKVMKASPELYPGAVTPLTPWLP